MADCIYGYKDHHHHIDGPHLSRVPLNAGYVLFQADAWTRFVTHLFS